MKIVTRDNFCRDVFLEQIIVENVNHYFGEELVKLWNDKYWDADSDFYFELVEDEYVLYDGYKEMYGDIK